MSAALRELSRRGSVQIRYAPATSMQQLASALKLQHQTYKPAHLIRERIVVAPTVYTFVIDPRTSHRLAYWDTITAAALLFTAIITPFEVAFLQPGNTGLFILNRMIDVVFFIDLVLQFFLAYPAYRSVAGEGWVTNRRTIANHYLRTWFSIDLLSTAVSAFDIVGYMESESGSNISKLKALRLVRVVRLVKLVRLLRGLRIFKRWETQLSINYFSLQMVAAVVGVVMVSHWAGCMWMLQTGFRTDIERTWLYANGYCIAINSTDPDRDPRFVDEPPTSQDDPGYGCMSPGALYAAAFYWAIMTITGIGYGDVRRCSLSS